MKFYNLSFHFVPLTLLQKWPKVMQTWIVLGLVFSISCTCMTNILYAYFVTAPNQEFLAIIKFPITLLFALQTTHLVSLSWHVINIWLLWCLWGWTILRYSVIQIRGSFIKYTVWNWPRNSVDLSYLVRTFSHSSPLTLQYTEYFFKYSSW